VENLSTLKALFKEREQACREKAGLYRLQASAAPNENVRRARLGQASRFEVYAWGWERWQRWLQRLSPQQAEAADALVRAGWAPPEWDMGDILSLLHPQFPRVEIRAKILLNSVRLLIGPHATRQWRRGRWFSYPQSFEVPLVRDVDIGAAVAKAAADAERELERLPQTLALHLERGWEPPRGHPLVEFESEL